MLIDKNRLATTLEKHKTETGLPHNHAGYQRRIEDGVTGARGKEETVPHGSCSNGFFLPNLD